MVEPCVRVENEHKSCTSDCSQAETKRQNDVAKPSEEAQDMEGANTSDETVKDLAGDIDDLETALKHDLLLSGIGHAMLRLQSCMATSNLSGAGIEACELVARSGGFTKQVEAVEQQATQAENVACIISW